MDSQLSFSGAESNFATYWPYGAQYDQIFPPSEDLTWCPTDNLTSGYAAQPIQYYDEAEYSGADWTIPGNGLPITGSEPSGARPRSSTAGSKEEPDGLVTANSSSGSTAAAKQAQRRQTAKVTGQFRCGVTSCPRFDKQPFGSSSDLRRHLAEAHCHDPKGAFFPSWLACPWPECARSGTEKLFKRQKNLNDHLAKKHNGRRPVLPTDAHVSMGQPNTGAAAVSHTNAEAPTATMPLIVPSASPEVRAIRGDRRKHREHMKQRILSLQQRGSIIAGEIADVRVELVQLGNTFSHLQAAEKANDQNIRTLKDQLAESTERDAIREIGSESEG